MQRRAKEVLRELAGTICPDSTERSIASRAVELLGRAGLTDTWYYSCPALVLLGTRSCLSISGKDYVPSDERVGERNVVTVDLSPRDGVALGDCARTFIVEDGRISPSPETDEFCAGLRVQSTLHSGLASIIGPSVTMHDVWSYASEAVSALGFENLDFLGNFGHNLVADRNARHFVERGNHTPLSQVTMFTFEPHIRVSGGKWGYKHENVYYLNAWGKLEEL